MEYKEQWEDFKVIKKFTIFPVRIYQYSSHRIWWSWMKTSYILQGKCYPGDEDNVLEYVEGYLYGYFYKNSRMSDKEEYEDYLKNKIKN